jgi:phytoene/squalene synthetase
MRRTAERFPALRCDLLRAATGQLLAGCARGLRQGAASIFRKPTWSAFGVSDGTIAEGVATPEFRALMRYEVDYARSLFEQGLPLIGMVNRDLALDLDLFSRGGLEILRAIERQDYDVLSARPAISKSTKLQLALRAVSGKLLPFLRLGKRALRKAA